MYTSTTIKNQVKTIALLGGLSVLLVLVGSAISPSALWVFGAIAVVMNLVAYFWSDKIVLRMNHAHPIDAGADPELFGVVEELARRGGIPTPRVYVIDDPAPNAFATGRNPEHGVVAVTTGIRRLLTTRELRGVLAHELAHIKNRDILVASIAAMIATVISFVASAAQWAFMLGTGRDRDESAGGAIGGLIMAIVAPIAATVIQLAISRSREYLADAEGARLAGDPLALASALAKLEGANRRIPMHRAGQSPATSALFIVAPFAGSRAASWFSTHPPIAERIRRLEELAVVTVVPGLRQHVDQPIVHHR
jgi:heat shock protein HtpX